MFCARPACSRVAPRANGAGDLVAIGRIRRPHGVHGEFHLEPYAADLGRYASLGRVVVGGTARRVVRARVGAAGVLLTLEGVADREAAQALAGEELFVAVEERAALPADRYYVDDLIGLAVVDRGGARLGTVAGVLAQPAQDLLEVDTPAGRALVPLVRAIVVDVDLAGGRVVVDPPAGLIPGVGGEPA
jgi:16S rRNA processing protein RimM